MRLAPRILRCKGLCKGGPISYLPPPTGFIAATGPRAPHMLTGLPRCPAHLGTRGTESRLRDVVHICQWVSDLLSSLMHRVALGINPLLRRWTHVIRGRAQLWDLRSHTARGACVRCTSRLDCRYAVKLAVGMSVCPLERSGCPAKPSPNLVVLPNRTLVFAGSGCKCTYAMLPQSLFLFFPVVALVVVNAVETDVVNE